MREHGILKRRRRDSTRQVEKMIVPEAIFFIKEEILSPVMIYLLIRWVCCVGELRKQKCL